MTGAQKADDIENNYILPLFTSNGVKPTWLILNEISAGTWPNRPGLSHVVGQFGCSSQKHLQPRSHPALSFGNPGANNADWQRVSTYCYIGIEKYLSGQEINANGNSVTWCQNLYQGSKDSYLARGVAASKTLSRRTLRPDRVEYRLGPLGLFLRRVGQCHQRSAVGRP